MNTTSFNARPSRVLPLIALPLILACGISPMRVFAQNVAYPKIEASFNLPSLATDPFDYTVTDVRVQITQPDASTISLPAFFDGGTTWRVRHTPFATGLYTIAGVTLNGSAPSITNLQPTSWTVSGPANSPGYVRVDPANARRFIFNNGRRYFPVGHDNAWDVSTTTNVAGIMSKMGPSHENWSRVWMDYWDGKNLDWPSVGAFGQLNLTVAQKWDGIVASAEQAGMRFQMTLHHHGEYSSTVDPNWPDNPYNTANGGFLSDATQFFTNAMAISLTERKLRYIAARWGYSTAVMGWELFNEVQFTDAGQDSEWTNIGAWHDQMAVFLRSQDFYKHPITTSSDMTQPIWSETDYYQHHDYPTDLIGAIADAPDISASQPVAPVFGGECGMDFTPHIGVSPTVWAGLMAGQSGNEEPWYWDVIDANNDYNSLRAESDFVTFAGVGDQDSVNKSAPVVTCPQTTSLVFSPGASYADATQSVFTVGFSAPDGIGSLPSFLQGDYHRDMTPNGYTFLVNYPVPGTFSVQITEIAASGDALTILVDNQPSNSVSFASTGGDYNTNYTLTVNVPAGAHSIVLTNPGLDWIVLGDLTLNPYVPMIGAYEISNPQFAAVWLWHRTNIYFTNATSTVSAQVQVGGLTPGNYAATWWDTYAGVALSNFTFNVASSNLPVTLNSPPILRSLALYAGPAARAGIAAPPLTQFVGTNSPSFTVPLIVTNSGGLPLNFSLAVTNLNPVTYAALNSAQPGGPLFAWKDISGVGVDISSNFVALAAPKLATDEGIAGPINLGFNFPFFSGAQSPGIFNQAYVSPNGFITFSPFSGDTSSRQTFPTSFAPSNCIALYWRDMSLGTNSHIYTFADQIAETFTVQFENMTMRGASGNFTGQIVLKPTGEILMQYQSIGTPNSSSEGLQNAVQTQGLSINSGLGFVQTNFAVYVSPAPWLAFDCTAGFVPRSNTGPVNISFNAAGLPAGNYSATLLVNTGDSLLPQTALPVNFTISSNLPAAPSGLLVNSFTWSQVALSWSNNAANASGLEIQRAVGSNGVYVTIATVGGSATNFTDTTATSQTTYYYRIISSNNFGLSQPSAVTCAVTPLAPVDLWRQAHFGAVTNSGIAADTADPDHDGLINLIEYAFASDPNIPSPYPISSSLSGNHLLVVFKRPHPAPLDIDYLIEVNTDLISGAWISNPGATTLTAVSNNDGTETVTVTDTTAVNATAAHYLRIRIARQ